MCFSHYLTRACVCAVGVRVRADVCMWKYVQLLCLHVYMCGRVLRTHMWRYARVCPRSCPHRHSACDASVHACLCAHTAVPMCVCGRVLVLYMCAYVYTQMCMYAYGCVRVLYVRVCMYVGCCMCGGVFFVCACMCGGVACMFMCVGCVYVYGCVLWGVVCVECMYMCVYGCGVCMCV